MDICQIIKEKLCLLLAIILNCGVNLMLLLGYGAKKVWLLIVILLSSAALYILDIVRHYLLQYLLQKKYIALAMGKELLASIKQRIAVIEALQKFGDNDSLNLIIEIKRNEDYEKNLLQIGNNMAKKDENSGLN